jgi:hypothetical protein
MSILFVKRLAVRDISLIRRKRIEEQRGAIISALRRRATTCTAPRAECGLLDELHEPRGAMLGCGFRLAPYPLFPFSSKCST